MSHSDTPLSFADRGKDWLDRGPAVDALRGLLGSPALSTPLVLGIYGGWGTGKTSVMQTLRDELHSPDRVMVGVVRRGSRPAGRRSRPAHRHPIAERRHLIGGQPALLTYLSSGRAVPAAPGTGRHAT